MYCFVTTESSMNELIDKQEESQLCSDNILQHTVTSLFAHGYPLIKSSGDAVKVLFSKHRHYLRHKNKYKIIHNRITQEELDIAANFGRFLQRPSDIFLKVN